MLGNQTLLEQIEDALKGGATIVQLREIIASVSIPAVAIGGISYDNVCEVKGSSVSGVAVVSAYGAPQVKYICVLSERNRKLICRRF